MSRAVRVFYGGTFDPVHCGHLAIACSARDALTAGLGTRDAGPGTASAHHADVEIRLMPAADPPHRAAPGASAADRVAMLRLAVEDVPGLCIDMRELERGGRSWTIDTLHALRLEYGPDASIAWLVGADSLLGLSTWKSWRELFALTHFIVADRAGSPLDGSLPPELAEALIGRWVDDPVALEQSPAGRVLRLHQPQAYSATDVRARIASGLQWRQLLPTAVADYIVARNLYGSGNPSAVIGP